MTRVVHYVGFRCDRYGFAKRIFGGPAFIHRVWDRRAQRDIGSDDLVIFATGPDVQDFNRFNASDIIEPDDPARIEMQGEALCPPRMKSPSPSLA